MDEVVMAKLRAAIKAARTLAEEGLVKAKNCIVSWSDEEGIRICLPVRGENDPPEDD